MKNNSKNLMLLTTFLALLPMLLGALLYNKLPAQIPVRFDMYGDPSDYASRFVACFGLPLFLALVNFILHFSLESDPKKKNQSPRIKNISKWVCPIMSLLLVPMSLFISLGKDIPIHIIVPCLTGVLIVICGNYMPKSRQNYTIGIKIPWTLSDEDNWNKTHRLAGILWMAGGGLMIVLSLLQLLGTAIAIAIVGVLVIIPIFYSYNLYSQSQGNADKNKNSNDTNNSDDK